MSQLIYPRQELWKPKPFWQRWRNASGQRIRFSEPDARMNDDECCCGIPDLGELCADCEPDTLRFPSILGADIGPAVGDTCNSNENCDLLAGTYALDFWGYEGAATDFVDYYGGDCGDTYGEGCIWGLILSGTGDDGIRLCDNSPTVSGQVLNFVGLVFRIRNLGTSPTATWEASLQLLLTRWNPSPPDTAGENCPDDAVTFVKVVEDCADIFPFSFYNPTSSPAFFYDHCDWDDVTALVS